MMDDVTALDRRRFLQQSTGVATLTAISAAPAALAAMAPAASDMRALVVYRADDAESRAFADAMQAGGATAVVLGDDIVRQWRDQLQSRVVDQGYRLVGRTGYADWFMLRGLAAEHRIFPQHEQQPTSHSFDWVI